MIKSFLLALIVLASASAEEFVARITYYSGSQTASGTKPVQGSTVAAANNLKIGTKLSIPELAPIVGGSGVFVVHDRGPAVQSRRASRGKLPVIDVYVRSRATVRKLSQSKKTTFKVKIIR